MSFFGFKNATYKDAPPAPASYKEPEKEASYGAPPAALYAATSAKVAASGDAMITKTFTRWWNMWLEPKGTKVTDISAQIQNGVLNVQLLDAVTGSVLGRYSKAPKNKYQMVANHTCFVNNLQAKGIDVTVAADDLECGDKKSILEVTWQMIFKFEMEQYGCDEDELMAWCNEAIKDCGLSLTSWSTFDPKAYAAIIAFYAPDAINYRVVSTKKPVACAQAAFDAAYKSLGIPILVDATDACSPDATREKEMCIMTYVAKLHQACTKLQQAKEAAEAAAKIAEAKIYRAKEVVITKEMYTDLIKRGAALKEWCSEKEKQFSFKLSEIDKCDLRTLEAQLKNLKGFHCDEKPPKETEQDALAKLYAVVEARIAADNAAMVSARDYGGDAFEGYGGYDERRVSYAPIPDEYGGKDDGYGAPPPDGMYTPPSSGGYGEPKGYGETETYGREASKSLYDYRSKEYGELISSSPSVIQVSWNSMEAAEYKYEDALIKAIGILIQKSKTAETDKMAECVIKECEILTTWCKTTIVDLCARQDPAKLGDCPEDTQKLLDELVAWGGNDAEKAEKKVEKIRIQEEFKKINMRRIQECRDKMPPYSGDLEMTWKMLETQYLKLYDALLDHKKYLILEIAIKATDKKAAECDVRAKKWYAEVTAKIAEFKEKIAKCETGSTIKETQALLAIYREKFVAVTKYTWAVEKTSIEELRMEIDIERKSQYRGSVYAASTGYGEVKEGYGTAPSEGYGSSAGEGYGAGGGGYGVTEGHTESGYKWEPSNLEIKTVWADLIAQASEWEHLLLSKLGDMKADMIAKLRKKAAAEEAASTLNELLPPLVYRAMTIDMSIKCAATEAGKAPELLKWIKDKTAYFTGLLTKFTGGYDSYTVEAVAAAEAYVEKYDDDEKPIYAEKRRQFSLVVNDMVSLTQLHRYEGTPPGKGYGAKKGPPTVDSYGIMVTVDEAWAALEVEEGKLRAGLCAIHHEKFGCARIWERLRRGCDLVKAWSKTELALVLDKSEVKACSEAEAVAWLWEARLCQTELLLQVALVQKLKPLYDKVMKCKVFKDRAAAAYEAATAIVIKQEAIAIRIERLEAEVERQRRLAMEALLFASYVRAFQMTVFEAKELAAFPLCDIDNPKVLYAVLARGKEQLQLLIKPLEGCLTTDKERSDALRATWAKLSVTLEALANQYEKEHDDMIKAAALKLELSQTKAYFESWYEREMKLLILTPPKTPPDSTCGVVLKPADVSLSLWMAEAQLSQGDYLVKKIRAIEATIDHLNLPKNACTTGGCMCHVEMSDCEYDAAVEYINNLAWQLRAVVASIPAKANPYLVIKALKCIEDGAQACPPLECKTLKLDWLKIKATCVDFLFIHVGPGPKPATLNVNVYDPFPLDKADYVERPVPPGAFDSVCQGFVVVDHLNACRADPKSFAAKIKKKMAGAYNGTILTPPWAFGEVKIETTEGEAAFTALLSALEGCAVAPAVELMPKACSASMELASVIAAGKEAKSSSLADRVKALGYFSGAGLEAYLKGKKTRDPLGIVIQMLMCDGDAKREFFPYLMHKDLKWAGFSLVEECDTTSALTLMQTFYESLGKEVTVSADCYEVPSTDFLEVCEAIPEATKAMVLQACEDGKSVSLAYKMTSVEVTIAGEMQVVKF